MPIYRFGTEEQSQRWLPPLCRGEELGAFALTEPGGGSDARRLRTTAAPRRGTSWVINGTKAFITNSGHRHHQRSSPWPRSPANPSQARRPDLGDHRPGRHARAHRLARSTPRSAGWPPTPTSSPSPTAGYRSRTCSGERAAATPSSSRCSTRARIGVAAISVGLAQGCVDESLRYGSETGGVRPPDRGVPGHPVQDRRHGGPDPHGPPRLPARRASRHAHGEPFKKEAAIAKLVASDAAVVNAREATQIFGGYGFVNDTPVGRFYRDAKILEIGEGTSEVLRILIARELGVADHGSGR